MAAKVYAPSNIRNIVLIGHGGCGKTSLAEAMLFVGGATNRLGSVDGHSSVLDFEPEEHKRGGSIQSSLAWIEHEDHKVNLLDTPGDQNFVYDTLNAMRGADAAIVVIACPDQVEVNTERFYKEALRLNLPRAIFINKMDRDRADVAACLADIEETLGVKPLPVQVPIGAEHGFRGVVSLFQKMAFLYGDDSSGRYEKAEIPAEVQNDVDHAWETLVETVASTDDDLLEQYLETFELSVDQVKDAFRAAVKKGDIVPVFYGAATRAMGAVAALDMAIWAFPSPVERGPITGVQDDKDVEVACTEEGPFLAQVIHTHVDELQGKSSIFRVFRGNLADDPMVYNLHCGKTERMGAVSAIRGKERTTATVVAGDILSVAKLKETHTGDTLAAGPDGVSLTRLQYPQPMMAYVIKPATKADADKIKTAVERILEEDPTLSLTLDALTQQMVLNGMGETQIEMAIERMRRKYKVNVDSELPAVHYRETLATPVMNVEGKHKKQTGGAGQFGVAFMNVVPLERDGGFEFTNMVKGGAIPNQFIPAVEKGIHSRMRSGFLAGYPIVDIRVELVDGKYHPVDSKDVAFQMAGSKGLRLAFEKGGTRLLEPIMSMEIVVPTECMGDVMGDMNGRRGQISGMDQRGRNTVIMSRTPMAEVQRYAPVLKGLSGGKGTFTMQLAGYEEVPRHLVDKIIHESPFKRDEEED